MTTNSRVKQPQLRAIVYSNGSKSYHFTVQDGRIVVAPASFNWALGMDWRVVNGALIRRGLSLLAK